MEETLVKEPKQKGNPNFFKKKEVVVSADEKLYEFVLIKTWAEYKPKSKVGDKVMTPPYPPVYGRPNEGIAYDEETKQARAWRYIEGQPSIWVDEQPALKEMEERQINALLGQDQNQLEFRHGRMVVRGINKLRLKALMVQDAFEGKEVQYRQITREYRLVNPDAIISSNLSSLELEYSAMKKAMECTTEEMIQAASAMGIDTSDLSDAGVKHIKMQFLTKAKFDPTNPKGIEFFLQVLNNPATRMKYIFQGGIDAGFISATQQMNKLTWAGPNTPIMDINSLGNVVDQLVAKAIDKDEKTLKVLKELENQLGIGN